MVLSPQNRAAHSVKLFKGDCLEQMANIPDRSVNLIYCDLPYGRTMLKWDIIIPFDKLWAEYERILTKNGVLVLHCNGTFTGKLMMSKLGWYKQTLIWRKTFKGKFFQSSTQHLEEHEEILIFSPGTCGNGKPHQVINNITYNPQGLVLKKKPHKRPNRRQNGIFSKAKFTEEYHEQKYENYPRSILNFPSADRPKKHQPKNHNTQKPVALAEYLIRTYSNDGDVVLDNCMGSGTAGVACGNIGGRHFVGIEGDPHWFAVAEARIAAAYGITPGAANDSDPLPVAPPVPDLPTPDAANDPVPVFEAANDHPTVAPDLDDEIVNQIKAVCATRIRKAKVPSWKAHADARRKARREATRAVRSVSSPRATKPAVAAPTVAVAASKRTRAVSAPMEALAKPKAIQRAKLDIKGANDDALTILQGDCRKSLASLPANSVHSCISSPPYFNLRDYQMAGQIGLESSVDAYVQCLVEVFREVRRVLRKDGTVWLNLGDSYGGAKKNAADGKVKYLGGNFPIGAIGREDVAAKQLIGIPWRVAFALQADGWYLRQDIIWSKPNCTPESVTDRCTKSHEYIFLLSKSPHYYFNYEAIMEPAKPDNSVRNRDETKLNNTPGRAKMKGLETNHYEMRRKRSVWNVATKAFKGAHFAAYPDTLVEPCVLAGCPLGGTILDPFGGSGTTGGVALKNGRKAILCELNPDYIKHIMPDRLKAICPDVEFETKVVKVAA